MFLFSNIIADQVHCSQEAKMMQANGKYPNDLTSCQLLQYRIFLSLIIQIQAHSFSNSVPVLLQLVSPHRSNHYLHFILNIQTRVQQVYTLKFFICQTW